MKMFVVVTFLVSVAAAAWAGTAFFKYEMDCGAMKKTCVYDYLGDDYYMTIDCVDLCPLSVEVD